MQGGGQVGSRSEIVSCAQGYRLSMLLARTCISPTSGYLGYWIPLPPETTFPAPRGYILPARRVSTDGYLADTWLVGIHVVSRRGYKATPLKSPFLAS